MKELAKEDLQWCLKRLPKDVKVCMKKYGDKLSVGGGFIRSCITGDELKDVDMFVSEKAVGEALAFHLNAGNTDTLMSTKNAITLLTRKPKLQFITRWTYAHPEEVIGDLDFTVCCAVIWYDQKTNNFKSACHDLYYEDLAARRLRYTAPKRIEEAGGSALRILKYYNKGYKITLQSYGAVIARLVTGWDNEKSAIRTEDEDFNAAVFTGLMVEVDPCAVEERQYLGGKEEEENDN